MDYYICIDSGGTKTETVLADSDGRILYWDLLPGANHLDIGIESANSILLNAVLKAIDHCPNEVSGVFLAAAGINRTKTGLKELIFNKTHIKKIEIDDDRRIVLAGTIGMQDGCGFICGTGCSLSVVKKNQIITQIGGYGYLIDTKGSGFDIGQAGLEKMYRFLDGRGKETILPELMEEKLGPNRNDWLSTVYSGGRAQIAALAQIVFKGAELGDSVCLEILDTASSSLAELTIAAEKYFDNAFPVVMTGGIFLAYPKYRKSVYEKASKKAIPIKAKAPPVYGALVEAMWYDGRTATESTRNRFLSEYAKHTNNCVKYYSQEDQ